MPPAREERIPINSPADLAYYFQTIQDALAEKETEDSWQRLDKALAKLEAVTKGGGYKFDEFVTYMKHVSDPLTTSLLSERTRLSGTAADVIASVAPRMADRFEALVNYYVPALLQLCARTNKVALKRAEKCLQLIARHCKVPNLLPLFREASRDKYAGLRAVAVACTVTLFESGVSDRLHRKAGDVEAMVSMTAKDSNPEVRQNCKKLFQAYIDVWPERVESYTAAFSPTIRKYLALPKTGGWQLDRPSERPVTRPSRSADPHHQPQAVVVDPSSSSGHQSNDLPNTCPPSPKRDMFLEALAAAKNKKKNMPSTLQSTGALRSFSTASLFGGAPYRLEAERSRSQHEKEHRKERYRAERTRSEDEHLQRSLPSSFSANGEGGPSRAVSAKVSAMLKSSSSSSTRLQRSEEVGLGSDDAVPVVAPLFHRSTSNNDANLRSSSPIPSQPCRTSRTAPVTPLPSQDTDGGMEYKEHDGDAVAPSDGVAQRLAALERQERVFEEERAADRGVDRHASTICHSIALPAKTPKALRVMMPVQDVPSTLQRQTSAVRVAVSTVASLELPSLDEGTGATSLAAKPAAPDAPVLQPRPATQVSKGVIPAANKVSKGKVAIEPEKSSSKSTTKPSNKVTSSTTKSLTAKKRALGASASQKPASSAPAKSIASKAAMAQAAREAIVAKKQAEVAKMKAANKARAEAAASRDSAYQAAKRTNVQRLKTAASSGPAVTHLPSTSSTSESLHKMDSHFIEQTQDEQTAAAAWDKLSTPRLPSRSVIADTQREEEDTEVSSRGESELTHQMPSHHLSGVPNSPHHASPQTECSEMRARSPMAKLGTLSTPVRPPNVDAVKQAPSSPARTPLGSLTPNTPNTSKTFPAVKSASTPMKSPGKTPQRHALSSPADKLIRRDQLLQQQRHRGEDCENFFVQREVTPLRPSPLKSRPVTPRSLMRGTQFRPRNATAPFSPEDTQSDDDDQENQSPRGYSPTGRTVPRSLHQTPVKSAVPRHLLTPFASRNRNRMGEEYDSSASSVGDAVVSLSVRDGNRLQLICGRGDGVDEGAETDVDVERLISF